MINPNDRPPEHTDYEPDWVIGHQDAVHEDNWAELEATKGLEPISYFSLESAQSHFGTEHVYTGDRYDERTGRALRHMPGTSIYIDAEGRAISDEKMRKWQEEEDQAAASQSDDPGSN
jgi:hypothetical protein